jgi:hypothetical protein
MIVYTVHEPAIPARTPAERADEVVFVREGTSLWGFLLPPVWMLFNALWLELAGVVFVAAGLSSLLAQHGLAAGVWLTAYALLMPAIGFEGASLLRARLERKGYIYLASVAGGSRDECERRFFDAWLPGIASRGMNLEPGAPSAGSSSSWGSGRPGAGVVGTFPGEAL